MKARMYSIFVLLLILVATAWYINYRGKKSENPSEIIIKQEKDALDRWNSRDVWGYLNLFAEDASYFDNTTKKKLQGYKEIKDYIAPFNGQIYCPKYEMKNIDVAVERNMAVLSYNLYNFNEQGDTIMIWNSSEAYQKIEGEWKIIHAHWSVTSKK